MSEHSDKKRDRASSLEEEEELDLPEVKKLKQVLLENLEDFEVCSTNPDLDSFMKSFEEEISLSPEFSPVTESTTVKGFGEEIYWTPAPSTVTERSTDNSDLGYLLEASDDELGLPPSKASPSYLDDDEVAELVNVSSDSVGSGGLGELWGFDEHIIGFDSFDFGVDGTEDFNGVGNEYVALDGLFDYSDMGFGSDDFVCRPETLPAQ